MSRKIDVNRGVSIRRHKESGMYVYMYKDEPGIYYNAFEVEISDNLARQAGFNVDEYAKKKLMREAMAKAQVEIARELEFALETKKVVEERNGYKIVDIGSERYFVESPEGQNLNPVPVPRAVAVSILDSMFPKPEPEVEKKPVPEPQRGQPGSKSALFEPSVTAEAEVVEAVKPEPFEEKVPATVEPRPPQPGKKAKSGKSKAKASLSAKVTKGA